MKHGDTGLLRVLLDVYQSRLPNFIHLTADKLWVADLALQDSGGEALTLQCFDLDGAECLHETLYRMDAGCPAPYCWFTDNAVLLFHAPEDPADREDTALTLRWFPLDTLEEQVWRVGPGQLPGELTGVIRQWSEGDVLTVQGTFHVGDDVQTAYVSFDLTARSLSVAKPGLFGVLGKKEPQPPEDGPDPERLVINESMICLINTHVDLPNGTLAQPVSLQADETHCRAEFQLVNPDRVEDQIRTVTVTGPHCGRLFPFTIEGCRCVMLMYPLPAMILPYKDMEGPFPGWETTKEQPIMPVGDGLLEVERGFADAHLTRSCREEALYRDDRCYRWRFDHTAWAVPYELPAFFVSRPYGALVEMLSTYCGPYLKRTEANGDLHITFDTLLPLFLQNFEKSRALLEKLPACKLVSLGLKSKDAAPSPFPDPEELMKDPPPDVSSVTFFTVSDGEMSEQ